MRPHVICQPCYDAQSALWTGQSFLYCEHFKALALGRNGSGWIIQRKVAPERARALKDQALARLAKYCERRGMTLADGMALTQEVYELRKARPKS